MGVGVNNVEAVIKTVLKNIGGLEAESLPKSTFSRLMFTEARRISQIQVAETLIENFTSACTTLHTDGTSKFGQHYGTYVVLDSGQTLIAGIREVATGDTNTQLNVLLDIFKELEESLENNESDVSKKMIASIKNIMSDRHIVQKKFNTIFQEY